MSIATTFVLIFLLLTSVYIFYYYIKTERTVVPIINEVNSELTATTTNTEPPKSYTTTPLLFPNIRWAKMPLSVYTVAANCTGAEADEVIRAMKIWKEKTNGIVSFTDTNSPDSDVTVDCLEDSSSIRQGRKIIRKVGEGGPSSVYDTGLFNLTTKGKIYLFTSSVGCENPIIALHELGHVLGLDHSENPKGVMYEYEECDQDITSEIVNTISSLYSSPAKPDLYFSSASAYQKNFYLFINMTIKNQGLVLSQPTSISVVVDGKAVKTIDIESLKPAQGYFYSLSNLFISHQVDELKLLVDTENKVDELSKSNNEITLRP